MERMTHFRIRALLLFFVLILTFFGFRLYDEQIYKTGTGILSVGKDEATVLVGTFEKI